MDDRAGRIISNLTSFESLASFEANARRINSLDSDMSDAIRKRSAQLGEILIRERTGLSLEGLSPAEAGIVRAISEYVGVMQRQGKDATRTFEQLKNRGLIGAAESAVSRAKPSQGFQTLSEVGREDISYEQIVLDYPEEFSPRAIWYSRRTLGLPNDSAKPPAPLVAPFDDDRHDPEEPITDMIAGDAPYWVFVCNPKKWAIDRFLERHIEQDHWGVRKSDRERFAPGQLGVIRVGVDQRTVAELAGRPRLTPGIYALCEVDSTSFPGTGAADEFWSEDAGRAPGWPTVNIRYLRTYLDNPLTIERLRTEAPGISPHLLNGLQASSFPISEDDFRTVLGLLREDPDDLPSAPSNGAVTLAQLAAIEERYLLASPEVKERLSKSVERGPIGALVKKINSYKCQICEALGQEPLGFRKKDGQTYVEAHHVTPVAKRQVGTLAASNVMTLCANHHRHLHYGSASVTINATTFDVTLDGRTLILPRLALSHVGAVPFSP